MRWIDHKTFVFFHDQFQLMRDAREPLGGSNDDAIRRDRTWLCNKYKTIFPIKKDIPNDILWAWLVKRFDLNYDEIFAQVTKAKV